MGLDEVLHFAKALSPAERDSLIRELGGQPAAGVVQLGALADRPPSPHSVAWVKAERGHAVLATDTGPADTAISEGPEAIVGMWDDMLGVVPAGGSG